MVAPSRVETTGLIVAFVASALLLAAWGLSGFAIDRGDYETRQSISARPDKFGCYDNGKLRVIISNRGLSIPGTEIDFTLATVASDKRGEFIYFEPAIDLEKTAGGGWRAIEDNRSMMIQKFYLSANGAKQAIIIPTKSADGIVLPKVIDC